MINLINNYGEETENYLDEIHEYVKYIMKTMNVTTKSISVVFINDEDMRNMNNEFRDLDKTTDVLSFPSDSTSYLGDIIISIDKTKKQAQEYENTLKREIYFLITHGFLHLLGYDHYNDELEKKMIKQQKKILSGYEI